MTTLERLKLRTTEPDQGIVPDERVLKDCIESARSAILARRYPFGSRNGNNTELEDRYLDLQFRIALDLYNKIGAEGEVQHIENGIHRNYNSEWISKELLQEVVPYCGVL